MALSETVTVRRDDLETMMAYLASGPWTPAEKPGVAEAWRRLTEAKDAGLDGRESAQEPPQPPGDYGCVHVMGHTQCEGWVSDGSIAGAACLDVRDEAGRLIAKIPPHSVYMYEPRIPPRVLAAASTPLAELPAGEPGPLPSGAYEGYYEEPGGEDEEPADAFAGHRGPDETAIL